MARFARSGTVEAVNHTETSILEQLASGGAPLAETVERARELLRTDDKSTCDEVFFALGVLYISNLSSPNLGRFSQDVADIGGLRGLTTMAVGMSSLLQQYDRETGVINDESLNEISYLEQHSFSHALLSVLANEAGRAILQEHEALRQAVLSGDLGVARHRLALEQFDEDYAAAIAYASDSAMLVELSMLQSMRCGVRALITLIQQSDEEPLELALCGALESSSPEWRALWSDGVRSLSEEARQRVLQSRGALYSDQSVLELASHE